MYTNKLQVYKFDSIALDWVTSYLSNRKQCIINNDIEFALEDITAGVPQGSMLGPVLFLLFINDLPLFIKETYLDIYADNLTVNTANKSKTSFKRDYKLVLQISKNGVYEMT